MGRCVGAPLITGKFRGWGDMGVLGIRVSISKIIAIKSTNGKLPTIRIGPIKIHHRAI